MRDHPSGPGGRCDDGPSSKVRPTDAGTDPARRLTMGTGWADPSTKARTRGLSRREFMRESGLAALAAGGVAGTAGCLGSAEETGAPTAKIGYLPITDAAPLLIGAANDHFADHGVEVEEPVLFRGWSDLAEAFLSEQVNIAHFLMPMTVWMRYSLDAPIKVVAWDHTDGSAVTVQDHVGEWADLGGHNVAVPFWYSIHNVIVQMGLRDQGLTPRTDVPEADLADDEVNLVVMPPPDMPAALDNGSIEGYVVAEPFNAIGELSAGGRILRFTGDVWKQHACCVVVLHESALEAHPEWSENVLKGLVDSQSWLRRHRHEAAGRLSNEDTGLLPFGPEPIDRALTHYDHDEYGPTGAIRHDWGVERIGFYPYPYPSYTEELVRRLTETRVEGEAEFLDDLDPSHAATDLVDDGPVRTALEAAGGPPAFDIEEDHGYERTETIRF